MNESSEIRCCHGLHIMGPLYLSNPEHPDGITSTDRSVSYCQKSNLSGVKWTGPFVVDTNANIYFTRFGPLVSCWIDGDAGVVAAVPGTDTWTSTISLPIWARPPTAVRTAAIIEINGGTATAWLSIYSDGRVTVRYPALAPGDVGVRIENAMITFYTDHQ